MQHQANVDSNRASFASDAASSPYAPFHPRIQLMLTPPRLQQPRRSGRVRLSPYKSLRISDETPRGPYPRLVSYPLPFIILPFQHKLAEDLSNSRAIHNLLTNVVHDLHVSPLSLFFNSHNLLFCLIAIKSKKLSTLLFLFTFWSRLPSSTPSQSTQRRSKAALNESVPHIVRSLSEDMDALKELGDQLPHVGQQLTDIAHVYDRGRLKVPFSFSSSLVSSLTHLTYYRPKTSQIPLNGSIHQSHPGYGPSYSLIVLLLVIVGKLSSYVPLPLIFPLPFHTLLHHCLIHQHPISTLSPFRSRSSFLTSHSIIRKCRHVLPSFWAIFLPFFSFPFIFLSTPIYLRYILSLQAAIYHSSGEQ